MSTNTTIPTSPADDVALNVLGNVIRALGPTWERRLTDAERLMVRACCNDAARLGVRAMATPRNRELQLELLRERAEIHARLANCLALGEGRLADVFWEAFASAVNGALAVALTAM
jgi:hypothetical protein